VKKILIAYDGSPAARRALAHVAALAGAGDWVFLVHVVATGGEEPWPLLDEAVRSLAAEGIRANTVVRAGDAAAEIADAAAKERADLIVIGRDARKPAQRDGSIADRVVRVAPCDVLVVHAAGLPA
jgi:nucleotide-binding universal stress UspA family protein